MATYSEAQRRALLNADLERGHLRLTDSAGNRVHGMTLRTLLRHGLIERLWPPIPLTEFGAAEAQRLHDAQDQGAKHTRGSVPATSDFKAMTADDERFALAVDTPGQRRKRSTYRRANWPLLRRCVESGARNTWTPQEGIG